MDLYVVRQIGKRPAAASDVDVRLDGLDKSGLTPGVQQYHQIDRLEALQQFGSLHRVHEWMPRSPGLMDRSVAVQPDHDESRNRAGRLQDIDMPAVEQVESAAHGSDLCAASAGIFNAWLPG